MKKTQHKLLTRQMRRYLPVNLQDISGLRPFISAVDQSYQQMDEDRKLLERSLELSSIELRQHYVDVLQQLEKSGKLREEHEQTLSLLDSTLEATADAILVVDSKGEITYYNKNFLDLWNIPSITLESSDNELLLAIAVTRLNDPDAFMDKVRQLHLNPEAMSMDIIDFKDGRIIERSSRPQLKNTKPVGRVWSFRDITSQIKNEQELKNYKDRFEAAQKLARIGHFEWNVSTDRITCSQEVANILGFDSPPTTLRGFLKALQPAERKLIIDNFHKIHKTREQLDLELPLSPSIRLNGVIHLLGQFEDGPDGALLLATIHDITSRKFDEAQLRLARKIFESANEGIIITDTTPKIVEVNQAFCNITGYKQHEVIGLNPNLQKSGRHNRRFFEQMWNQLLNQGEWVGEIWDRRKDGEIYPKWLSITALKDDSGKTINYVGIFSDISSLKKVEEQLENLAYYDPLTKLPNRSLLNETIKMNLIRSKRENFKFAVLFLDLDRFKYVNDSLGHLVGDELLKIIAARLRGCLRKSDTVARLGGDEFTVVLAPIHSVASISEIATKIQQEINEPVEINGHPLYVSASIGICIAPDDGVEVEQIMKCADVAMYQAKENGKGHYQFYNKEMQQKADRHLIIQSELLGAIRENELTLYYQPVLSAEDLRITSMEALIRWQDKDRGLVPPNEFIPIAEENGLILPMGNWVIKEACRQNRSWHEQGLSNVPVTINLSARQFLDANLVNQMDEIITVTGLHPALLEVEITESASMGNPERTIAILDRLNSMGIVSIIDDFGTGYSSLAYLKRFPVHKLKIDRSFVRDIIEDPNDAAIAQSIIALAQTMNLKIVAEGVETEAQAAMLRELGCHYLQGYYYSKPLPANEMEAYLKRQRAQFY